jgi:hypothetical protein
LELHHFRNRINLGSTFLTTSFADSLFATTGLTVLFTEVGFSRTGSQRRPFQQETFNSLLLFRAGALAAFWDLNLFYPLEQDLLRQL